jgi:hypothetical protein
MVYKKGLDGRERDRSGRIREKNGALKIRNAVKEYPEFRAFSPDSTLTNLKKRYKVQSLDELRKLALIKERSRRLNNR